MEPVTRTLGDRYELRSLIATGGMGQVWRAHDQRLRRPVAVKVLRSEFAGDDGFLARFRAEARHTALLGHRNVTAVYDYGETTAAGGEQLAYLVMELVPGDSLAGVRRREGALAPEQVLEVVAQAAAGLGAAHEAGIVHRDVKPGNLLLRPDGSVAVTDFGIAWSAESVSLTATGQIIGTAHYLSPEQARGQKATPASDVYALGMVAYELLAGRRAFDGGSSVAVALSQINDEPDPLPPGVPGPVRDLVAAMLVKDPAGRLADGDAVVAAAGRARAQLGADEPTALLDLVPPAGVTALLTPALDPEPDPGTGTATRAVPPPRRRRLLLVGLLAALVLVGGGTALLLGLGGSAAPAAAGPGSSAAPSSTTAAATTTAAPTSEAPATVTLDAAAYTGRPLDEVVAQLTALGLDVVTAEVAGDGSTAGLVVTVDPAGTPLPAGSTVTVGYGSAAPAAAPTTDAAATVVVAPAPATTAPAPADPGAGAGTGPGNGNGNGNGTGPGSGNGNGNGPGSGGPGNGNGPGGRP